MNVPWYDQHWFVGLMGMAAFLVSGFVLWLLYAYGPDL